MGNGLGWKWRARAFQASGQDNDTPRGSEGSER